MAELLDKDTIVAVATPPGQGGIAIVRLSGPQAKSIAEIICQKSLTPRQALFSAFKNNSDQTIDNGIVIYFKNPHSFTGEDVVEFQSHGNPFVIDQIIDSCIQLNARLAKPGEFSERAFLNNKIDLLQAEAIADLISANTQAAARSALHSLQGEFSKTVNQLIDQLIALRIYIEASLDFPEEEIDFLSDQKIHNSLQTLQQQVETVFKTSQQGQVLNEGLTVVIAGKPNAGKSSLLNALAQRDSAIVTHIPGTTRDILKEQISIDGMPLHIIDTAGLRFTEDAVESEGIRRAQQQIQQADHILLVVDSTEPFNTENAIANWPEDIPLPPQQIPLTLVVNKTDQSALVNKLENNTVYLSAKQKQGVELLCQHLKNSAGYHEDSARFTARRRHLDALEKASQHINQGYQQLLNHQAGELLAEDLVLAQRALEEITGRFTPDDLLEKIFRDFCIGK